MKSTIFRTEFGESIFNHKYKHKNCETWEDLSKTLINHVCSNHLEQKDIDDLIYYHSNMKFIAGGRYLYYAGRETPFFNNCYLLKSLEDSRQDWADLSWKAESCLMTGGGIGNDYSMYRAKGLILKKTGGLASGPVSKMKMVNEIGREVMQGGSRRSALYASLNWKHPDIGEFLHCKDWYSMPVNGVYDENGNNITIGYLKEKDFNYPAPLDMTNISLNYDNEFLEQIYMIPFEELKEIYKLGGKDAIFNLPIKNIPLTFLENCRQALKTGEPGFSFNFFEKVFETLRNAPISGNTYVLTKEGYLKVFDIVNKPVEVWTGKQWALTTFKKTIENAETLNIVISGKRNIVAELNHEFFVEVYRGKGIRRKLIEIKKVKAKDLKVGDILHVSLNKTKKQKFNSSAYTLGYTYGDGSFRKEGGGEITFCSQESKECFKFTDKTMYSSVTECDSRGFVRAYISREMLDTGRNKYTFPSIDLINLPSFLAGLFDSDGSYDKNQNRIRVSSIHFDFLQGVRRALESIGILSGITSGGVSTYGKKEGWTLAIMSDFVNDFIDIIPTVRLKPEKNKSYRKSVLRVKAVIPDKIQDVFCCDVGVEEHSFMAEGVIISNCTEVTSEDDSDVCNLASVNMAEIETIEEFKNICYKASKFLLCGTIEAELPYQKVYNTREKNRRLGLGLMGVHEWLLKRGYRYEVNQELREWLEVYKEYSEIGANEVAERLNITKPKAYRAIAPTGTIGILAGTTTGIEPLFAVAYKRRFLKGQKEWHYQYVIDGTAKILIDKYNIKPEEIETALSLSEDYERRIKFQADIQDYVDMSISSTINLPKWGTELNNDTKVEEFAHILAKYAVKLRGFTCYPDGARGGQPLTIVNYYDAKKHEGKEFKEFFHDICDISGKGGTCGV